MDIQALVDAVSNASEATRKDYHLSLGDLISKITDVINDHGEAYVQLDSGDSIGSFNSYRGYYSDLAISSGDSQVVEGWELLNKCKKADGATFQGYKGGDFQMNYETPLWYSNYESCTNIAIVGATNEGPYITLVTKCIG